ncbi:hypothetical protein O6H91_17G075100 [Diphasiastrum complanatum]|uniref:Uncharacterized protein n=2 Tax=Diphasiastrum complanatum TaxID=34168 RepID=A0ACC2B870_DIPCM|nr:hypothetical protein O6H91_17G074500 [Diphasiastrum complanatum]KAJ7525944.1 hypothetical protein O6H91_17G075100 [Diphasiastrum complanatum]
MKFQHPVAQDPERWATWKNQSQALLYKRFLATAIAIAAATGYLTKNGDPNSNIDLHNLPPHEHQRIVDADNAVVAADVEECSIIGRNVLQDGGNAVDAAVATALCEGVFNSMASGIGGGAFMLLRLANGTVEAYDMREVAPIAASENMYAKNPSGKKDGPLSIGVPGEVAGLYLAWQRHGKLPWRRLFQPAIDYAIKGYPVHPYLASSIRSHAEQILASDGLREIYAPGGKLLQIGDSVYHKELGNTLESIARHGPGVLYNGTLGRKVAADVQSAGGILTFEDFQEYKVQIREPVKGDIHNFTVLGMPPPSSGGAALILILNILLRYNTISNTINALDLHRTIEAFKHAFAVRMNLGDPDFVNVEGVLEDMLSAKFAAELQETIVDNRTFSPEYYGGKWNQLNDHGTCHLSIIDQDRNAVALTTTINGAFGSFVLSTSTGILLNNEMDDFSIPADIGPNDPPPPEMNFIRPFKRPLSSMSPTILLQNGQLRAVLGASGGKKIITATAQVLIDHVVKGIDPLTSVSSPRVHHQLIPNIVEYENWTTVNYDHVELSSTLRRGLVQRGHILGGGTGAMCQLAIQNLHNPVKGHGKSKTGVYFGKLIGVSDYRKDGAPAGY